MWWTAVLALVLLRNSNAQLTSPSYPVCPGSRIIITCHQSGDAARWRITIPAPAVTLENTTLSSQIGMLKTFINDPGFNFEISVASNSSLNSITTVLQVTAVIELNGVTVECIGPVNYMSTIQVVSVAAPSGVMATNKQFTKTGASVNVSWSTSRGADNYTVNVTPPIMPGQLSDFTTTDTNLLLMLDYNVNYTINITAIVQSCTESNSTVLPLIPGCSPPSPPTNGRINEYHNGSVGASLTFQCNTGYLPHEQVTSTCMENGNWVPIPQCSVVDCGYPNVSSDQGVVIEPSWTNDTLFNDTIVFHCEEGLLPDTTIEAVCGSTGVWSPNPANHMCVNESSAFCSAPAVPTGAHISDQSTGFYPEGASITLQCKAEPLIVTMCHTNGSWIPSPSELVCITSTSPVIIVTELEGNSSVPIIIGISLGVSLLLIILILMVIGGIVLKMKRSGVESKPLRDLDASQDGVEYSETRHPGPRGCQHQLQVNVGGDEYSVISRPAKTEGTSKANAPSGQEGHTLIYADLGPSSSSKRLLPSLNVHTEDRVVYSALNHAASTQRPAVKSEPEHAKSDPSLIDSTLDLDSLLIQLKPQVTQKWKEFANVVGLSNMIRQLSRYSAEECIVEICDQWLKSHPTKPTWRDIANVAKEIGLDQLSEGLLMAYNTGELPISVDMDAIPDSFLADDNEIPPPLPPKIDEDNLTCAPPKVPARPPRS